MHGSKGASVIQQNVTLAHRCFGAAQGANDADETSNNALSLVSHDTMLPSVKPLPYRLKPISRYQARGSKDVYTRPQPWRWRFFSELGRALLTMVRRSPRQKNEQTKSPWAVLHRDPPALSRETSEWCRTTSTHGHLTFWFFEISLCTAFILRPVLSPLRFCIFRMA